MYKSPIEIKLQDFNNISTAINELAKKQAEHIESTIFKACMNVKPNINEEELLKALEYDRQQYEKGYADGKKDAVVHAHWVNSNVDGKFCRVCSNCGSILPSDTSVDALFEEDNRFCYFCGYKMDEVICK